MSKYPGTYTTKDVCKAEIAECKGILKAYHVPEESMKIITGILEQAYHQLSESYRLSTAFEAYALDELGK